MHLNVLLHRFSASHHLSFLMSSYFHLPSVIQSPEACTCVISPPFLVQTSRRNVPCLTGWCLVFIWAAACSGCNLLYTQVVWLCCKPESSAGFLPFSICREMTRENRAEEATHCPRAEPCFRQPPGLGWLSVCPTCCSEKARGIIPAVKISPQLAHSRLLTCRETYVYVYIYLPFCLYSVKSQKIIHLDSW